MPDHPVQPELERVLNEHASDLAEIPDAMVGDWVLVASVQSLTSDANRLVRVGREGQLGHNRDGLLHQGLYGFDDD